MLLIVILVSVAAVLAALLFMIVSQRKNAMSVSTQLASIKASVDAIKAALASPPATSTLTAADQASLDAIGAEVTTIAASLAPPPAGP